MQYTFQVNKKEKALLVRKGHKLSSDWKKARAKRWIFIYGGYGLPFLAGGLYYLVSRFITKTNEQLLPSDAVAMALAIAVFTWSIATVYWKILSFNCSIASNYVGEEGLILSDTQLLHSYHNLKDGFRYDYIIPYVDIVEITYNPQYHMLYFIGGHEVKVYNGLQKLQEYKFNRESGFQYNLPAYYKERDQLLELLQKNTGITINLV